MHGFFKMETNKSTTCQNFHFHSMASSFSILLVSLTLLVHFPSSAIANLHKSNSFFRSNLASHAPPPLRQDALPTAYFEVTKPIGVPNTKPCSVLILRHDFAYTYGQLPALANYTPPSRCPSREFSKIVLEWTAASRGRQFDRIFGVWLDGVELLRSCTAEPRATGTIWTVKKDVTRYSSLLLKNETQTLAVYLGNIVDKTYTGVYHVNLTLHFYPAGSDLASGNGDKADLILPISRNLPLNDGLWFEIENSTDTKMKEFKIPQNVYRAVLEVYVSFHENDESWYANLPNEYVAANNLSDTPGNGPFREVLVSLDGVLVGAVWPFTVVFTGGINPLLWRPITGIGSFNLPSYDIEITPFLGGLLDGKSHEFGFSVTNALNLWYIDANLHVWVDPESSRTEGKLLEHNGMPLRLVHVSDFKGLNGSFLTNATRVISSSGWVKSSKGTIVTQSVQELSYGNSMKMEKNGDLQIVDQVIHFDDSVYSQQPSSTAHISTKSNKRFIFFLYADTADQGNGTFTYISNTTLGFDEDKYRGVEFLTLPVSSLRNLQNAQGSMVVKDNLVESGVGNTQQVYKFEGRNSCYLRNISSSNYSVLYDEMQLICPSPISQSKKLAFLS